MPPGVLAFGRRSRRAWPRRNLMAVVVMFALLAYSLYYFARKKLD
jgi:hypothetical protein